MPSFEFKQAQICFREQRCNKTSQTKHVENVTQTNKCRLEQR